MRLITTKVGIVAVIAVLLVAVAVLYLSEAPRRTAQAVAPQPSAYLEFLKTHTPDDWQPVWEQLWACSSEIVVPASIVAQFGSQQNTADKILEHIRAYAFWTDLPVEAQLGFGKTIHGELKLTGIVYFINADELVADVERAINFTLPSIKKEADPLKRTAHIDLYLRQNVTYGDTGRQEGQTIHSAFVNREAVCAGITYSYNVLALMSGLDSRIVVGYLDVRQEDGSMKATRHAWNAVTIDGVDYFTDSTVNITDRYMRIINVDEEYLVTLGGYTSPEPYATALRLSDN